MSKSTKEQVTAEVGSLQPKSVFSYGGIDWLVLGRKNGNTSGVLCLAEKELFNKAFANDNCNNWEDSSLREHLNNDFLEKLLGNGAAEAAFMPMVTDLTADDGLKDYGTCEDLISLISCQQYRKYRGIIPNADGWWWTCTACSTKANGYSYNTRIVISDGSLSYSYAYHSYGGVRPLCTLQSSILVSAINAAEGEELEETSEDDEAADQSAEQDTPPERFEDDIRTQRAIDGFYECIEVAQQRYKGGKEDFTGIISAISLIKYLKGDLPF